MSARIKHRRGRQQWEYVEPVKIKSKAGAEIRRLGDMAYDRLNGKQRSEAFSALISYLAGRCDERGPIAKSELVECVETACSWADSNVSR